MNFKDWLLHESFDSISEFLLNPDHKEKDWDELMDEFKSSGGKLIGVGKKGQVFSHPRWPYVLKMYNDEFYTSFVRFAFKNPHSAFPKFFGPPKKVTPFYKRYKHQATSYLVRMEKLEPIDRPTFNIINAYYDISYRYFHDLKNGTENREVDRTIRPSFSERRAGAENRTEKVKVHQQMIDLLKSNPELSKLFEGMYILITSGLKGSMDVHEGNFMKRSNGDVVFVDPFWEGSNPYSDAMAARRTELDDWGDYHDEMPEPDLMGGELPKKKRKRRRKIKTQSSWGGENDPPF